MIGINEKLSILYYDGVSTYTDYSLDLFDYASDPVSLTLASTESIYIGFRKPLNTFYVQMDTYSTTDTTLSVKYYNGSSFVSVTGLHDETRAFKKSGFVIFDRNLASEAKTTINSTELYWYELSVAADTSASVFRGINIVYSSDADLKTEVFEISDYLPNGENSFILSHAAARNEIIQKLRTDGRYKLDFSTGVAKDITAFDLLDVSQVRVASTYLVLSKIYSNLSDETDDVYSQKSDRYKSMYNAAMQHFFLWLDTDDDGTLDIEERTQDVSGVIQRR